MPTPRRPPRPPGLPDVRDGLSRLERVILVELARAARELGRARVPTALLYGRVQAVIDVREDEFTAALTRLTGAATGPRRQPR